MPNVENVKKSVAEFLVNNLNLKDIKVIKVTKENEYWDSEAEVLEESSFMKSLGFTTRIQERYIYEVKLDNDLLILAYERKELRSFKETS